MNFWGYVMISLSAIIFVWFLAIYYHIVNYRIPKDHLLEAFLTFLTLLALGSLAFVFYFAGINWSQI